MIGRQGIGDLPLGRIARRMPGSDGYWYAPGDMEALDADRALATTGYRVGLGPWTFSNLGCTKRFDPAPTPHPS